jgi:hypothetical protein
MESAPFVMGTTAAEPAFADYCGGLSDKDSRGADRSGALVSLAVSYRRIAGCNFTLHRTRNVMYRTIALALFLAVGLPSLVSAAPIYRCTGPTGATVFSQVPCG